MATPRHHHSRDWYIEAGILPIYSKPPPPLPNYTLKLSYIPQYI